MAIFKCIDDGGNGGIGEIIIGEVCIEFNTKSIKITKPTKVSEEHNWIIGTKYGILPIKGYIWKWEEISFNKYLKLCK